MAGKLKRSKAAIVDALAALRDHGFLTWVRRYVEADGEGARGPQVKQTSNAYRLLLPDRARKLLRRRPKGLQDAAPTPADHEQGTAARAAELRRFAAQELDALPGVAKALLKAMWPGVAPDTASQGVVAEEERESTEASESGPQID
jgi:hypothetical protein